MIVNLTDICLLAYIALSIDGLLYLFYLFFSPLDEDTDEETGGKGAGGAKLTLVKGAKGKKDGKARHGSGKSSSSSSSSDDEKKVKKPAAAKKVRRGSHSSSSSSSSDDDKKAKKEEIKMKLAKTKKPPQSGRSSKSDKKSSTCVLL